MNTKFAWLLLAAVVALGAATVGPAVYKLSQCKDVTLSSPTAGQVLTHNGTVWANAAATAGTVTNLLSYRQITYATNAIPSTAVVYVDFSTNQFQYLALTNNITFHSTNRAAAVRATVLRVLGGTTNFTLAFNTNWVFVGAAAPTSLASNKTAVLSLTLYGTNETDVLAAYAVQP